MSSLKKETMETVVEMPKAARVRLDCRGRVLLPGEDVMPDGRYRYRFQGIDGSRQAVYSWRLLPEDPAPVGRRRTASIREWRSYMEETDRRCQPGPVSPTLNRMFYKYMEGMPELRPSTRENYWNLYHSYIAPGLGRRSVSDILYSDMKAFYVRMATEGVKRRDRRTGEMKQSRPFRVSSLGLIQGILHPLFDMAVRDGIRETNPCEGLLREVRRSLRQPRGKRHALTVGQQERLIFFVAGSDRFRSWLPILTVFLGTGCRVGELIGLCWEDCDFQKGVICINRVLIYRKLGEDSCRMHVSAPKSAAGQRTIPMLSAVREVLLQEKERQRIVGGCKSVIDGVRDFVFRNRDGRVHNPSTLNRALERIRSAYNIEETAHAAEEGREPDILPHFSCHTFRHTFCTRFCENEENLKMIQSIMGHADITTTMNIYAEATEEKKQQTMEKLEGKMRLR